MKTVNLILVGVLGIFILGGCTPKATAQSETRVVVTGEDSDPNSVKRNSEVFKRVIAQLQESFGRAGYFVIDEDILAVRLGFSINSRRPKAELIETLMVANNTTDATVQSRLAVVFGIFPQVKELSFTKKLEIRIRGDVYDIKTLRPLSSFEYQPKQDMVVPKNYAQCDEFCVEEMVGSHASTIARELGDILVKKLEIAVSKIGGSSDNSAVANSSDGTSKGKNSATLAVTYNLKTIRLGSAATLKFKKWLEARQQIKSLKTIAIENSQSKFALETDADMTAVHELILEGLMEAGINVDNVRVAMSGTEIEVDNLN